MFTLRFDMRAPDWGAPIEELYAAAVEMAAWAEGRGALVVVLSEHHATADRHLPSPLVLATAMAARTDTLGIMVAALVLPFYEPVRLAEDMAVLDIISRGRFLGSRQINLPCFSPRCARRITSLRLIEVSLNDHYPVAEVMMDGLGFARDMDFEPR